jgi:hypothetical protein
MLKKTLFRAVTISTRTTAARERESMGKWDFIAKEQGGD